MNGLYARTRGLLLDGEGCVNEPGASINWPTEKMARLAHIIRLVKRLHPGFRIGLCTGRQAPYAEGLLQAIGLLGFTDELSVVLNGTALLRSDGSAVWHPCATPEKRLSFNRDILPLLEKLVDDLGGRRELGKDYCFSARPPSHMSVERFFAVVRDSISRPVEQGLIEATHSMSAVDITIAGVNKRSGAEFWMNHFELAHFNVAAVGDSAGDLPVLGLVGLPGCPANASEAVKNLVASKDGYCSPWRATLGVIDFLGRLFGPSSISAECERVVMEFARSEPNELSSYIK